MRSSNNKVTQDGNPGEASYKSVNERNGGTTFVNDVYDCFIIAEESDLFT